MSAVLDPTASVGHRADASFATLFAANETRLLAFCRSIVRDEHDARDALQNCAVRALAGFRAGEVRSNPRAWLFSVARTESLMLIRRRRDEAALDGTEGGGFGPDPEARALAREAFAELVSDLEALAPRARQALVLREAAGLDYAEIARVLECGAGAARQAVSEARSALKADREARGADCTSIRSILDAADGRARRARSTRAHLRGCAACREWQAARPRRARRLCLPPFVGLGWLEALLTARVDLVVTSFVAPRGVVAAVAATAAVASPAAPVAKSSSNEGEGVPAAVVVREAPRPATTAANPARSVPVATKRASSVPESGTKLARFTATGTKPAQLEATIEPPSSPPRRETAPATTEKSHQRSARHTHEPWDSSTASAVAQTSPSPSPPSPPRSRPEEPSRFASRSPESSTTRPEPSASASPEPAATS